MKEEELELYELQLNKYNRITKLKSQTGKFYCGCDRALVGESEKCPICNTINIKNRHIRYKK